MARQFTVAAETDGPITTVMVAGDVDALTAPTMDAIVRAHSYGPDAALVIDMLEVTFVDSQALNVLIGIHRLMFGDRRLILVSPPVVTKLLQMTGLDGLFELAASVAGARASLMGAATRSRHGAGA